MRFLDLFDQRRVFGKLAGFVLAVDQIAIDFDVEDSAAATDQLAINPDVAFDICRQTDGHRLVISLHAVLDRNVHFQSPRLTLVANTAYQIQFIRTVRQSHIGKSWSRLYGNTGVLIGVTSMSFHSSPIFSNVNRHLLGSLW